MTPPLGRPALEPPPFTPTIRLVHQSTSDRTTPQNTTLTSESDSTSVNLKARRRHKRYTNAQTVLETTFLRCQSEPSPNHLRIRALEHITSVLRTHAEDAQSQTDKLRKALADRSTDPQSYRSLQRQRWMAERRWHAAENEAKHVSQQLSRYNSPNTVSGPPRPISASQKRSENLVLFFQISRTQVPIRNHRQKANTAFDRSILQKSPWMKKDQSFTIPFLNELDSLPMHNRSPPPNEHKLLDQNGSHSKSSKRDGNHMPPAILAQKLAQHQGEEKFSHGTVTIYSTLVDLPARDALTDIDIRMPSYAEELLENFDTGDYDITLKSLQSPMKIQSRSKPTQVLPSINLVPQESKAVVNSTRTQPSDHMTPSRRTSYRRLNGLFSLPEALSSRLRVSESDQRLTSTIPSHPSQPLISQRLSVLHEAPDVDQKLFNRIKHRFSMGKS